MRARTGAIGLIMILAAVGPLGTDRGCAAELIRGQQRLTLTGSDSLAYSRETVSGGELATSATRYDSLSLGSGLTYRSDLYVRGTLLQDLQICGHLSNGTYGAARTTLTLTYTGSDATVAVGDLSVSLDGNTFVPFTRSLQGMKVNAQLDRGAMTLIVSRSKTPTKTDVFYGRNTSGPYYLSASPLVDGSEQVTVGGASMQRGRDYTLDYQAGMLLFDASRIIPPSSKVEVAYEYLSPTGLSGSLLGARAALPLSDRLDVGATYVSLTRPEAAGSSTSSRRDQWVGNNSAGPFPLSYRPVVEGSERVRVEGILQVRNVDYHLEITSGLLYFLRPVPTGTIILVDYEVLSAQQSTGGDQSVVGLDVRCQPDSHLKLIGQFAASRGGTAPSDAGSALGLQILGQWTGLSLAANWQAMSATFASLDSVGARGPQSGADLSVHYQPRSWATLSASLSDYRHAYNDFASTADSEQVREREREIRLDVAYPRWPTLSLVSTRRDQRGLSADSGLRDNSGSDSLRLAYMRTQFGMTAEFERISSDSLLSSSGLGGLGYGGFLGYAPAARAQDSEWTSYQATTTSRRFGFWYRPQENLDVRLDLAANSIATPESQTNAAAHSRHLAVSYSPWSTVSLDLDLSSYGTGQSQSPDGWQTPASASAARSLSLRYTPSARLAVSLTQDRTRAQGGYSGNTDSGGTTLAAYLIPCTGISLNATYGLQQLRYLGASGNSANHVAGLSLRAGPWRRLTLEFGYQRMDGLSSGAFSALSDSGGSTADSASTAVDQLLNCSLTGRLSYELAARHTAFVEIESSRTAGYPSQSRHLATALGWEYALSRLAKARLGLRRTVFRDQSDPRYDYVSNRLDAQIGLNF